MSFIYILSDVSGICESHELPIQQLRRNSTSHLNIFADLQFGCEGYIGEVDFYASEVGKFYISIWRLVEGDDQRWTLIGSHKIDAPSVGAHVSQSEYSLKLNPMLSWPSVVFEILKD